MPRDWLRRLVRAILGADAVAQKKLEVGNPLTVLGIQIEANLAGVVFIPDAEKARCLSLAARYAPFEPV